MFAGEAGAEAEGAHAVAVERAALVRSFARAVPVQFALGDRHIAQVGDAHMQYVRVASKAHIGRCHVGQEKAVVGNARAHARAWHVPPVHDVAGRKLPRRAEEDVFARHGGLIVHKQEHVL